jgi:ATP-dependent protease ClpP protease subunit
MTKELNIFGDIVSTIENLGEVSPLSVKNEISGLSPEDELIVNIDSFGGEVFAAVAIRGIIKTLPAKTTYNILGMCASAANLLFDENDIIKIAKGAMVMNHKPAGGRNYGNANELKKVIDHLDKIEDEILLKNLSGRTKKPINELKDLIADEWWLTSDEAILHLGFIGINSFAVMNRSKTKQTDIYKNYIEKKKALNVDVFKQFTNFKKQLKK